MSITAPPAARRPVRGAEFAATRSRSRGLSPTLMKMELLRTVRNKRTLIFAVVLPVGFYLAFGANQSYSQEPVGRGNVAAYIMISMALYGAMTGTAGGGATVATERTLGWTRQLRLTPLSPAAYVSVKVIVSMLLALLSILAVYIAGAIAGAHADAPVWLESALVVWIGSSVFAAFGLFVAYIVPGENAMQVAGPLMALMAFLGGLWMPLQDGSLLDMIGRFTPAYGVANLVRVPLTGSDVQWYWVVNLVAWIAIFVGGAAWGMRRDTKRA